MFGWLKSDPVKKLKKEYTDLTQQAFEAQRNGDIRTYSRLTAEAELIKAKIDQLSHETTD